MHMGERDAVLVFLLSNESLPLDELSSRNYTASQQLNKEPSKQ